MTNELWIALLSFLAGIDLVNGLSTQNTTTKIMDFVAFGCCVVAAAMRIVGYAG